ncbi:hypothetical protein GVX81_02625 [[Haemophilus] felis]|uniref:DUF3467 domain-containing protein n=1 Tax=[Haemophilus] felis TaxID=123822 RepID=A0A1T0B304_9PAST|nr:hypothetical protein [[Haemophilus] felis]NBI40200.1 hypothetical protein [[Haemophilus] felis]OOS04131.1 hypothetical protein B0188_05555 [[Haemophilus] felis]
MSNNEKVVFPINVDSPLEVFLNQNTGELVVECPHLGFGEGRFFRLIFEPTATLEIMSSILALEKEFGELIQEKAKQRVVQ